MDAQLITVSTSGDLHIPSDLQETLGLVPGSRVELTVHEGKLIARPINFDDIRALRGILSSEKGMVEELQQERRNEKW